eukprot:7605700-Pyramimonas_sp.AAC.1
MSSGYVALCATSPATPPLASRCPGLISLSLFRPYRRCPDVGSNAANMGTRLSNTAAIRGTLTVCPCVEP